MKSVLTATLMALAILPAAASARTMPDELARDRQDIREDRQDLREAWRYGDRRDIRDAREDLRESHEEYRDDLRDYRGERYTRYQEGRRAYRHHYAPRYVIDQPWRYRLARPYGYQRWVRHHRDALLIDTRRGTVIRVHRGYFG